MGGGQTTPGRQPFGTRGHIMEQFTGKMMERGNDGLQNAAAVRANERPRRDVDIERTLYDYGNVVSFQAEFPHAKCAQMSVRDRERIEMEMQLWHGMKWRWKCSVLRTRRNTGNTDRKLLQMTEWSKDQIRRAKLCA